MKVLLPFNKVLENSLEKQIQTLLEKSTLDGYALLSFHLYDFRKISYEIDAILILSPGIFVCLEAKNYPGVWTGSPNETWKCDGKTIRSSGTNPYEQVKKYTYVVKGGLEPLFCPYGVKFFVNSFIVGPDEAEFKIPAATVNEFQCGPRISICNLSQLEATIASISVSDEMRSIFHKIGIETIVRELAVLAPDTDLEKLCTPGSISVDSPMVPSKAQEPRQLLSKPAVKPKIRPDLQSPISSTSNSKNTSPKMRVLPQKPQQKSLTSKTMKPIVPITQVSRNQAPTTPTTQAPTTQAPRNKALRNQGKKETYSIQPFAYRSSTQKVSFLSKSLIFKSILSSTLAIVLILIVLPLFRYFSKTPIAKEEVIIGAVNSEKKYRSLQNYLDQELIPASFIDFVSDRDIPIRLEASKSDRANPYPEAIAQIRNYHWDIVFSYSPVIAIEAENQGYQFIAEMFPGTSVYHSTFFVREDSNIDFQNLSSNYTIALGDFFSASKFYMPVYDLYGASLKVIVNLPSKDIYQFVKEGKADIGVGIGYEQPPEGLKIIKTTRNLPSSGVYLSPTLSDRDSRRLSQLLLNAPQHIKKDANYDRGLPPDYQYFRGIVKRVREVSACSNFAENPVAFTCGNQVMTTIEGEVQDIQLSEQFSQLTIAQNSGEICKVLIQEYILKMAVRYNSISEIKGRRFRFYVGFPPGQGCSSQKSKVIYQPNQIEVLGP